MSEKTLTKNIIFYPTPEGKERKERAKNELLKKMAEDIKEGVFYIIRITSRIRVVPREGKILHICILYQPIEEMNPGEIYSLCWNNAKKEKERRGKEIVGGSCLLHPDLRWDEDDLSFVRQSYKNESIIKMGEYIEEGLFYVIRFITRRRKRDNAHSGDMLDIYFEYQPLEELTREEVYSLCKR